MNKPGCEDMFLGFGLVLMDDTVMYEIRRGTSKRGKPKMLTWECNRDCNLYIEARSFVYLHDVQS